MANPSVFLLMVSGQIESAEVKLATDFNLVFPRASNTYKFPGFQAERNYESSLAFLPTVNQF